MLLNFTLPYPSHNINRVVLVEKCCVLCEVETERYTFPIDADNYQYCSVNAV